MGPGAAAIATAAAAAATVAIDSADAEAAADEAALESQSDPEPAPERDPRADVMAEYFDVMRGFLEQQRAVVESWQARSAPASDDGAEAAPELPFLGEIVSRETHRLVALCPLSLDDSFLRSHVLSGPVSPAGDLSGLACVPLMVSVEILAEACSALAGSTAVQVIENVRAFDWIALDDEALVLEVHAEVVDAAQGLHRATIFNDGEPVVSADFRFEPAFRLEGLAALGPARPSLWSGPELYTTGMFHGPVFQSVRRVAGWNESGIDADLFEAGLADFFSPGETPQLVLNPVLLDAVGQVAAYWVAQQAGVDFNCFPSVVGRIELYAPCPAGLSGLTMNGRQRPLQAGALEISAPRTWDFECLDAAGAPLLRVEGLVNVFFPVPHAFYEVRRDPLHGLLGRSSAAAPGDGVALWEVPHFSEDFCAQSNGIFLRILAHALLGREEREEWRSLEGTVKHRRNGCSGGRRSRRRCGCWSASRPGSSSIRPRSRSCTTRTAHRPSRATGAAIWQTPLRLLVAHRADIARRRRVRLAARRRPRGPGTRSAGADGAGAHARRAGRAARAPRRGAGRTAAARVVRQGGGGQAPRDRPDGNAGSLRRPLRRRRPRPRLGRLRGLHGARGDRPRRPLGHRPRCRSCGHRRRLSRAALREAPRRSQRH
jgi:hypothetical protein